MENISFTKKSCLFVFVSFIMMIFSCSFIEGYNIADMIPEKDYLTFTAVDDDVTISFSWYDGVNVMYKKNNDDWASYSQNTPVSLANGDRVKFKGSNIIINYPNNYRNNYRKGFTIRGSVSASGCVDSLRSNANSRFQGLEDYCYSICSQTAKI